LIFWEPDEIEELKKVVNERIRYYNLIRRHSALGNKLPVKYLIKKDVLSL